MNTTKKIQKILEKYENEITDYADDYAEPGYKKSHKGWILLANWNNVEKADLDEIEKHHDIEWSDEWLKCEHCGNIFRCSGDSYGWSQYGKILNECEPVCGDCIKGSFLDDYQETLLNNHKNCDTLDVDWEARGFVKVEEEFEAGWYGRNESPADVVKKYAEGKDYIFQLSGVGQFNTEYRIYVREKAKAVNE